MHMKFEIETHKLETYNEIKDMGITFKSNRNFNKLSN